MLRIARIACPVDLSDFSRRALDHAALLARWYDAELHVVHVMPLMPTVFGFPSPAMDGATEPAATDAIVNELTAFVRDAATIVPGTHLTVRSGSPAVEVLRYADETKADLLVLGTHGRTGFERLVLGSVTEKVLRKAACPVLTVPRLAEGDPEYPLFRHVLYGADFSAAAGRAAEFALSLAQEARGRLTLLHVLEWMPDKEMAKFPQFDAGLYRRAVTTDARQRLEALVPEDARNWCEPDVRIACGKPYREIVRIADEEGADLIVLGVHGAGAMDRLLFGSTAQHVVRQARCPVLTVRT